MYKLKSQLFQILILSLCAAHVLCVGSIDSKNDENAVNYDTRTMDELFASIKEINKKLTEIARDTSQLAEEVGGLKEKLNKIDENLVEVRKENLKGLQPFQEFGSTLDELKKFEETQAAILEDFKQSKETPMEVSNSADFSNQLKLALDESSTSYSSCEEALKYNGHSGVYSLRVLNSDNEYSNFKVYCLKEKQFGGSMWTIIQRRDMSSGHSVDFNRTWEEYRNGFGDPEYDYWLGLDKIFMLTNSTRYYLWTKIAYDRGYSGSGQNNFKIGDASQDFRLISLHGSNKNRFINDCLNTQFNTIDRGNKTWVNSEGGGGGFWGPCDTNLNTQILRNGKWQINKDLPSLDGTYVHLAIRQMSDTEK